MFCAEALLCGDKASGDSVDMALYWDSWDRPHHLKNNLSPRVVRTRGSRASVPSEDSLPYNNNMNSAAHRTDTLGGSVSTLVPSCSVSSINSLVLSPQPAQCSPTPPLTPPVLTKGKGTVVPNRSISISLSLTLLSISLCLVY